MIGSSVTELKVKNREQVWFRNEADARTYADASAFNLHLAITTDFVTLDVTIAGSRV